MSCSPSKGWPSARLGVEADGLTLPRPRLSLSFSAVQSPFSRRGPGKDKAWVEDSRMARRLNWVGICLRSFAEAGETLRAQVKATARWGGLLGQVGRCCREGLSAPTLLTWARGRRGHRSRCSRRPTPLPVGVRGPAPLGPAGPAARPDPHAPPPPPPRLPRSRGRRARAPPGPRPARVPRRPNRLQRRPTRGHTPGHGV